MVMSNLSLSCSTRQGLSFQAVIGAGFRFLIVGIDLNVRYAALEIPVYHWVQTVKLPSRVQAMQESKDKWSTGQILPLLMLALPLSTAAKLYWGKTYLSNPSPCVSFQLKSCRWKRKTPQHKRHNSVSILLRHERSAIEGLICSTHSVISSSTACLLSDSYTPLIISSWNLGAREVFKPYCQASMCPSLSTDDSEPCHPAFLGLPEEAFELEYLTIEKLWFRILLAVMVLMLPGGIVFGAFSGFAL